MFYKFRYRKQGTEVSITSKCPNEIDQIFSLREISHHIKDEFGGQDLKIILDCDSPGSQASSVTRIRQFLNSSVHKIA